MMDFKKTKKLILVIFIMVQFLPWRCQAYEDYSIGKIRAISDLSSTSIFIEVSKNTGYVARELLSPPRIMLNLYPAKVYPPSQEITVNDKFVQKIDLTKDSRNVVKAVVDLKIPEYSFNIFSQNLPSAIVINIRPLGKDIVAQLLNKEGPENTAIYSESLPFSNGNVTTKNKNGIYRIVIDPGHGGKDPGAIGPSGVKEKDITLAIARRLATLLRENLNVEVFLTRDKDEFIPLDTRTEMANLIGGDLFISIHVNAAWDHKVKGVETFYNSQYVYGQGAEEVANRENTIFNSNAKVKNIIWDLIQNQYRNESKQLAGIVQDNLVSTCNALNRGVKSARFYVLRGINMPAILVEVGFISNSWEEQKLKKPEFQEQISIGIYKGLATYIKSFNRKVSG